MAIEDRRRSAREEARRRWGRARVLSGGRAPRPLTGSRRLRTRPRLPGTAAERRLVERIVGKALTASEMQEAIKLLRAGARLKELEINARLESILRSPDVDS